MADHHTVPNSRRAELIRTLQRRLGSRFRGGFAPSPYVREHFPDCLSDQPSEPVAYLQAVQSCAIVASTIGLQRSTPYKLPENLSASGRSSATRSGSAPPAARARHPPAAVRRSRGLRQHACERLLDEPALVAHLRGRPGDHAPRGPPRRPPSQPPPRPARGSSAGAGARRNRWAGSGSASLSGRDHRPTRWSATPSPGSPANVETELGDGSGRPSPRDAGHDALAASDDHEGTGARRVDRPDPGQDRDRRRTPTPPGRPAPDAGRRRGGRPGRRSRAARTAHRRPATTGGAVAPAAGAGGHDRTSPLGSGSRRSRRGAAARGRARPPWSA